MAERSFAQEVGKLRLGEGEEFHGEAILAVTKALLQAGVGYVGGYQGAPISHLMDVLSDAQDVLEDLGARFEASASEAAAAAMLAASVNYPIRGAVTWKSTVGTNVASDALANVASGGVTGGALVIIGEDYGEGSSIMQERSHAFAMKSQMWLLDPRPNLESIVEMVERGFELSEASNTPVMLELRIRACHVYGRFRSKNNRRPTFSVRDALAQPMRDTSRIVLPPANFAHEREKIERRWPAARRVHPRAPPERIHGRRLGRRRHHLAGRALQHAHARARAPGARRCLRPHRAATLRPQCHLSADRRGDRSFCAGKRAVLIVEEGQPEYIEQHLNMILHQADLQTRVIGKDVLPRAGEYTGASPRARRRGVPRAPCAAMARVGARAGSIAQPSKEVQALAALLPCGRRGSARAVPSGPFSRR